MFEDKKVSADDFQKFDRASRKILEVVKRYKATKDIHSVLLEVLAEAGNKLEESLGE